MKKNLLKLVFASAFAIVASYSVYSTLQNSEMSDLVMENVEALASDEGSVTCEPDKGDTCMVGSTPVKDYDEDSSWF